MTRLSLIFLGGGIGSILRYLLTRWIHESTSSKLPLGTIIVNISGCLAIGILAALFAGSPNLRARDDLRAALFIGVLGGYTTFSSYALETFTLATTDRSLTRAALNIILSNTLALAAAWIGYRLTERLCTGAPPVTP